MKSFKFRYKTKYSNSFLSTLVLLFVGFFVSLWLYFFINPQLTLILFGVIIVYLIYWNFRTEGKVIITINENTKFINIKGKVTEEYKIEEIYFGWNYAFVNHGKSINMLFPTMNLDKESSRPTSNTNQCIVLLKLKDGKNIVLIKELKPWSETRDLEYIGHLTDTLTIDYKFFINGSYWRFRKQVQS